MKSLLSVLLILSMFGIVISPAEAKPNDPDHIAIKAANQARWDAANARKADDKRVRDAIALGHKNKQSKEELDKLRKARENMDKQNEIKRLAAKDAYKRAINQAKKLKGSN